MVFPVCFLDEFSPMVKRLHARVTGRVQGVFFRASTLQQAVASELKGFVRNLPDGSVELEAEGEEILLNRLLTWVEHGPPGARVDRVEVEWLTPKLHEKKFIIL